jgi:hypothetical protein
MAMILNPRTIRYGRPDRRGCTVGRDGAVRIGRHALGTRLSCSAADPSRPEETCRQHAGSHRSGMAAVGAGFRPAAAAK